MKIKILKEEAFSFKNNFTREDIENSNEADLFLLNKKLAIKVKDKLACVLICGNCFVNNFSNKFLVYSQYKKTKEIIFEVESENLDQK